MDYVINYVSKVLISLWLSLHTHVRARWEINHKFKCDVADSNLGLLFVGTVLLLPEPLFLLLEVILHVVKPTLVQIVQTGG